MGSMAETRRELEGRAVAFDEVPRAVLALAVSCVDVDWVWLARAASSSARWLANVLLLCRIFFTPGVVWPLNPILNQSDPPLASPFALRLYKRATG